MFKTGRAQGQQQCLVVSAIDVSKWLAYAQCDVFFHLFEGTSHSTYIVKKLRGLS